MKVNGDKFESGFITITHKSIKEGKCTVPHKDITYNVDIAGATVASLLGNAGADIRITVARRRELGDDEVEKLRNATIPYSEVAMRIVDETAAFKSFLRNTYKLTDKQIDGILNDPVKRKTLEDTFKMLAGEV